MIEIVRLIDNIGTANIRFDETNKDFLFNNEFPKNIDIFYYLHLKKELSSKMYLEINENGSKELLERYYKVVANKIEGITEAFNQHRVNFLLGKRKNELSEGSDKTHEKIEELIKVQHYLLQDLLQDLSQKIEHWRFMISENELGEKMDSAETPVPPLIIEQKGTGQSQDNSRVIFTIGKTSLILLFAFLEKVGVIYFEGATELIKEINRNKFIEKNISYTDKRGNKNEVHEMSKVNSDFSKIKNMNAKYKKPLIKRLKDVIAGWGEP